MDDVLKPLARTLARMGNHEESLKSALETVAELQAQNEMLRQALKPALESWRYTGFSKAGNNPAIDYFDIRVTKEELVVMQEVCCSPDIQAAAYRKQLRTETIEEVRRNIDSEVGRDNWRYVDAKLDELLEGNRTGDHYTQMMISAARLDAIKECYDVILERKNEMSVHMRDESQRLLIMGNYNGDLASLSKLLHQTRKSG